MPDPYGLAGMFSFMFKASGPARLEELIVAIDVSTADDVGATLLLLFGTIAFVHFPLFGRSHPTRTLWHLRLPGLFYGVVGRLLLIWQRQFFLWNGL